MLCIFRTVWNNGSEHNGCAFKKKRQAYRGGIVVLDLLDQMNIYERLNLKPKQPSPYLIPLNLAVLLQNVSMHRSQNSPQTFLSLSSIEIARMSSDNAGEEGSRPLNGILK